MTGTEDAFSDVGFGENDDDVTDRVEEYKGKKGQRHRLSMGWWNGHEKNDFSSKNLDQKTPKMRRAKRVYCGEGIGYVVVTSPEIVKVSGKQPKEVLGTIIIQWPTDEKGALIGESFRKGKFKVLPWVLNAEKFHKLKDIHEITNNHLGKCDVLVSMPGNKEEKFQDLNFTAISNDNLFRKLLETDKEGAKAHVKNIMDAVNALTDAKAVENAMGRIMTPQELREKMGQGGISSPDESEGISSGEDVDNLLDGMDV